MSFPCQKRIDLLDHDAYDEGRLKADLRAKDPSFAQLSNKKQHTRACDYLKQLYDRGQTIIKKGVASKFIYTIPISILIVIIVSKNLLPMESSPHEESDASSGDTGQQTSSKRKIDSTDAETSRRKRLLRPSAEVADAPSTTIRWKPTEKAHPSSLEDIVSEKRLWTARQEESHTFMRTARENAVLLIPSKELTMSKLEVSDLTLVQTYDVYLTEQERLSVTLRIIHYALWDTERCPKSFPVSKKSAKPQEPNGSHIPATPSQERSSSQQHLTSSTRILWRIIVRSTRLTAGRVPSSILLRNYIPIGLDLVHVAFQTETDVSVLFVEGYWQ